MKKFRFISAWIFMLSVASVIFMFSSQPAEKSSDVSTAVSEKLFKGKIEEKYSEDINSRFGYELKRETRIKLFGNIVRKNAHFVIFFLFGISAYNLADLYIKRKYYAFSAAVLMSIFYALSDEIHQMFVPGRGAGFRDVVIDSAGALCGIILIFAVYAAIRKRGKGSV